MGPSQRSPGAQPCRGSRAPTARRGGWPDRTPAASRARRPSARPGPGPRGAGRDPSACPTPRGSDRGRLAGSPQATRSPLVPRGAFGAAGGQSHAWSGSCTAARPVTRAPDSCADRHPQRADDRAPLVQRLRAAHREQIGDHSTRQGICRSAESCSRVPLNEKCPRRQAWAAAGAWAISARRPRS